jgi:hypothetical protein
VFPAWTWGSHVSDLEDGHVSDLVDSSAPDLAGQWQLGKRGRRGSKLPTPSRPSPERALGGLARPPNPTPAAADLTDSASRPPSSTA